MDSERHAVLLSVVYRRLDVVGYQQPEEGANQSADDLLHQKEFAAAGR